MPEQEIRFALVMNGGVSLAVWIAGVSHEIDLIRRASTAGTPGARQHDSEVYALWQDLMQPASGLRRQLVVDVLAGTSAGGRCWRLPTSSAGSSRSYAFQKHLASKSR